jgi:uncharacterized protein YjbJ (UPF0337 family)
MLVRYSVFVTSIEMKELSMSIDQFKAQWKQLEGKVQAHWGELTENDIQTVNGELKNLVGVVEERYAIAREDAYEQVREWLKQFEYAFDDEPTEVPSS